VFDGLATAGKLETRRRRAGAGLVEEAVDDWLMPIVFEAV
jgi:hypothetical protein